MNPSHAGFKIRKANSLAAGLFNMFNELRTNYNYCFFLNQSLMSLRRSATGFVENEKMAR